MTNEAIARQLESLNAEENMLNIHFKQRNTITGLFIRTNDYASLESKNLWRIVSKPRVEEWQKTRDINLCRIFNGSDFTRLTEVD